MVMCWVMFRQLLPHFLSSWFPINEKSFLFYPVLHPIRSHVHCLEFFCLTVAVKMPPATEFSVFIGVSGWGKLSSWGTDVFPLCNSPPTSASDADATTCFRILHSVWVGPFAGDRRFVDYSWSTRSELR